MSISSALALLDALDIRLDAHAATLAAVTTAAKPTSTAAAAASPPVVGRPSAVSGRPHTVADSWTQTAPAPPALRAPAVESSSIAGRPAAAAEVRQPAAATAVVEAATRGVDRAAAFEGEMRRLHAAGQLLLERPPWRLVSGPPLRSEVGVPDGGPPARGRLRRVGPQRQPWRAPLLMRGAPTRAGR